MPAASDGSERARDAGLSPDRRVTTAGGWLGPPERPVFGWLTTLEGAVTQSAVLVLPAIGYQYWSSYRTVRVIAERLAAAGHTVLRLDYDGTANAAGDQGDPDRVTAWRGSAAAGAAALRALGCTQLSIVGVRLGGTFALLDGQALGADAVVAWEPVASGRRYVKEIRLLATEVPAETAADGVGVLAAAGLVYSAQTLRDVEALDLSNLASAAPRRTLVVAEREDAKLLATLRDAGGEVQSAVVTGGEQALGVPTEDATVPEEVVEATCRFLGVAPGSSLALSDPSAAQDEGGGLRGRVTFSAGLGTVSEEVVELGSKSLVAILTEPPSPEPGALTVVFLNSGSEPHIGSGRAWVEFSRGLAASGYRSVRVDFRGWGESPDEGLAPGRPYDQHCAADAVDVVHALRARGHERVVLLGLCAGAWIALRTALQEPLAGVIALNPQMYWRPGDPVEALMSDTRVRRAPERRREAWGGRWGIWTTLDLAGHRPWAARWLDDLGKSRVPVAMVFAEGDDGIEYLRSRVARRLERVRRSGIIRIVEVPQIDHSMHRVWLRPLMLDAIRRELEAFEGEDGRLLRTELAPLSAAPW